MSVHDGHRQRLRQRFLEHGLDSLEDHEVLELLLCYVIPRRNVNPLAHRLVDTFGSFANVLDAPEEELKSIDEAGNSTAVFIRLIKQVTRRYMLSQQEQRRGVILNSTKKAGAHLLPYFHGERDEVVYMACLDAKCKLLSCKLIFRGDVNSADISARKIVENALLYKSTSVVIAHNHTSGVALPSREDQVTTRRFFDALRAVDVILADHIIVADGDFVSMADNGFFR